MKRLPISVLALCLVVAAAGCSTSLSEEGPVDTAAFLGLEAGHLWNFGDEIGEEWPQPDSLQVFLRSGDSEGEAADDGSVPFVFTAGFEDEEPEALLSAHFLVDGSGDVVVTEIVDDEGTVASFDPPVVFGSAAWEAGDSIASNSQLGGSAVSWSVTLVERGEHEVYYGLFPDVARVAVDDGGATPLGGDWWLAANVGPIRLQTADDTIPDVELVTYR